MNELNVLYKACIQALGGRVRDDYSLVMVVDNEEYPILVDDKKTYLPVDAVLDSNTMDKVFFHPACESIISSETEIFKVIRKLTAMRLLVAFLSYPDVLFSAASKRSTKSMRSDVLEVLEPLKDLKQTEHKEIRELFRAMTIVIGDDNLDKRFIHYQITKGGKSKETGSKVYYRAKPQFPFYAEMSRRLNRSEGTPRNQKVDVMGVSITLKSLEAAVHIFRSILSSVDTPDDYIGESLKADAARMVAFFNSYSLLVQDMNNLQNLFRSDFDKAGIYGLEIGFMEQMEVIGEICRQVPSLPYNNQSAGSEESSSSSNSYLVNSVTNTQSNQFDAPANNGFQQQQQVMPSSNDGFKSTVLGSMQPGEVYQGFQWDPMTNTFIHHTASMQGPVIYKVTTQGNIFSREYGMQQQPIYNGYQTYNNQMMGYQQQQQQPPYYGGGVGMSNVVPNYNDGQATTF